MRKNHKRVFAGVSISMIVIIVSVIFFIRFNSGKSDKMQTEGQKQGFQLNDNGTVTLGNGYVAHGFYTKDGKLINSGDDVICEDGYIRGWIEFQQNITETMEYGLIIMTDFVQKKFAVEGKQYNCYRFSLPGNGNVRIAVEIPVEDKAYEMEYLIVPEPDAKNYSMNSESEWNNFNVTKDVRTSSYRIIDGGTESKRVPPVFEKIETKKLEELAFEGNTGFELVKSSKDLRVFDSAKCGSRACLCLGGMRKEVEAYAVVAFCDWKQTEFSKGEFVRCYTSVPDGNYYEEINFPTIKKDCVYQMFAFEMPFESRMGILLHQTFRIKLEMR